jgi:hypothetical protein
MTVRSLPLTARSLLRRTVVKAMTLAAAAALTTRRSPAAEPDKLSVKDPAAVALGYVTDAAQVDTKKYPQYVKGTSCENCLQLQGAAGNIFRPCSVFPGKLVSVSGWCSAWTAEM